MIKMSRRTYDWPQRPLPDSGHFTWGQAFSWCFLAPHQHTSELSKKLNHLTEQKRSICTSEILLVRLSNLISGEKNPCISLSLLTEALSKVFSAKCSYFLPENLTFAILFTYTKMKNQCRKLYTISKVLYNKQSTNQSTHINSIQTIVYMKLYTSSTVYAQSTHIQNPFKTVRSVFHWRKLANDQLLTNKVWN